MRRWLVVAVAGILAAPSPVPTPPPDRGPLLAAEPAAGPAPSTAALLAALRPALASRALGTRLSLSVLDVASGRQLLDLHGERPAVPASTAKLATAVAALSVLPDELRLSTRVVRGAAGDIVLVGGGDATLAAPGSHQHYPRPGRLLELAAQLKTSLHGQPVRRVVVDESLFTGPRTGPGWKPVYVTEKDVVPVSALELHEGNAADPALAAGRALAALLKVAVVVRGRAPVGALQLARVSSPTVPELVEQMLITSDNDLAEALGRQVAIVEQLPASFAGEAAAVEAAVRQALGGAALPAGALVLHDASGLSPFDHIAPVTLTRLLALSASDPRFGAVLTGLPVAGFDGTLQDRYRKPPVAVAAGLVRAKTGTLTGVSALAGLVRDRSGRLLAFDVSADGLPTKGAGKAPAALDAIAAALATTT